MQALLLGIIEGLTEFLPISSTGHLILASHLMNIPESDFLKSFEIIIQLGAILSVVCLYWRTLLHNKEAMTRLLIAFLPTAIIGATVYKSIKLFLGSESLVVWTLLIGGVILIAFEYFHHERDDTSESLSQIADLPYKTAFFIGLFQSIAMIPGVSRSGATIVGGMLLGITRKTIVEFSFLLAVPTMAAATALDLYKNAGSFSVDQFDVLAVGFVTSFVVAFMAIRFLLKFVRSHTFIPFGIYRIMVAAIFFIFVL